MVFDHLLVIREISLKDGIKCELESRTVFAGRCNPNQGQQDNIMPPETTQLTSCDGISDYFCSATVFFDKARMKNRDIKKCHYDIYSIPKQLWSKTYNLTLIYRLYIGHILYTM